YYPGVKVFIPAVSDPVVNRMPICESEVLTSIRMGLLGKNIGIEVSVVLPFSILPFSRPHARTILANFKGEVVERVWARRLSFFVLSLDAVDVNSKHLIAPLNTFKNFVSHPSPCPSVRADQNRRYRSIF